MSIAIQLRGKLHDRFPQRGLDFDCFDLVWSCSYRHSFCEFICTVALSGNLVWLLYHLPLLALTNYFSSTLLQWSLSLGSRGCDIDFLFRAELFTASCSLHIDLVILCVNHHYWKKKNLIWWVLRDILMDVYKVNVKRNLILCTFINVILTASPVRPMI